MSMPRLLSRLLQRIRRNPRPSLNDLDRKLAKYLDFRDGFFIEAGANDGYQQSNTYFLETRLGWRGVLVEGIPELFARCQALRKRSESFNCALVSAGFPDPTITMHFAGLMSVVEGSLKSSKAQAAHVHAGLDVQRLAASYSVEVPARTLASILDGIPEASTIDFFSLDVEGHELEVLKGLDLTRYRPRYILVEARFFDEVDQYLAQSDYELVEQLSHHDYLYRARPPGRV
jgi:FkbM family methyltransferase